MRILRIFGIAAGALLALAVLGILALLLFIDPNRYRGDIERVVKEHTARDLLIQGKLGLKVLPRIALSVQDVQLSNPPGFGSQPFLTVRDARIGVKLLPLLGKRIEVSRIALDGVTVNLVSRGEQNNWKDLSQSKGDAQTSAGAQASSGSISIEGVDLSKASLVYRDEVKKTTQLLSLDLHTGRLEAGGDRTALADLDLKGTWLARTVDEKAAGAVDEKAPGTPNPLAFSLQTSGLALDAAGQTLAPAKIEVKLGDAALAVSLRGEKMSTDRIITGSVAVPTTSPRKLLQSLGITLPVTRDSHALSAFGLQTDFRLTKQQLQLSALQLALDDTRVQGTAGIDDLDHSAFRFDLNVNGINLDRYRAPVDKTVAATHPAGPAKPPTPLPLEALRKLDVQGTLRVVTATFANLVFTDVVMPLVAKDGRTRLGPTQARLYGGAYNGDIILDARPVQAQLSLNEHVRGTDIGALVKAALDSGRLSGRADANVAVTGVGNTDEAMIRSLSGKIDANVKQGALIGIDMVYELQSANALLKRQIPPQRTGPARTVFNTLQTNGTLDKGVLRIESLRMETDFLKVHGAGTLDTTTEAINYQLVTAVNKLPAGGGSAAPGGLDALQAVEVPLTVTGTLSSPSVRPDIGALAKGALGREVQQKATDLARKKLGDQLKGLLGH